MVSSNIISGTGKVEIIGGDKAGDIIKLNILPDEGYILDEIMVTDLDGQSIELNNNEFIMPAGGAVVITKFLVQNPLTVDISIIILNILIILMFILLFTTNKIMKRRKELL